MANLITSLTFKTHWHLCYRSLVLRFDSDPASAGEYLWVGERRGKWCAELYELPYGSASLHHGDLCSTARALWHPSYHFCIIHYHWAHYVLPVCTQSQEETPPQHIRRKRGPHFQARDTTLHLWNECLPPVPSAILLQHSTPDLAIHFSTTQQVTITPILLSSCRAMCHSSKQELRWSRVGDMLSLRVHTLRWLQ